MNGWSANEDRTGSLKSFKEKLRLDKKLDLPPTPAEVVPPPEAPASRPWPKLTTRELDDAPSIFDLPPE